LDEQTPEELEAHYGPSGPAAPALAWMEALQRGDFEAAWRLTDPTFRLVIAQGWIWAHREREDVGAYDRDELAAALADPDLDHPLRAAFAEALFSSVPTDEHWATGSRPRPLTPGYELVLLVPNVTEPFVIDEPTPLFAHGILMHFTGSGWLVAGSGVVTPAVPGWPPIEGQAPPPIPS